MFSKRPHLAPMMAISLPGETMPDTEKGGTNILRWIMIFIQTVNVSNCM